MMSNESNSAATAPALRPLPANMLRVLERALSARAAQDDQPFLVAHLVTQRCMCRCASCLWIDNDSEDVPLDELKRFYAQARDEGFVGAALSGGEPFLRADLGQLARYLKEELGFATLLITTGLYLTRRMDEVLPYLDQLVVSLDSPLAERHDAIRGVPGLYARLMEGVTQAKVRYPHLPIHFNCCVQRGVEPELDALVALTRRMGLRISFDFITERRHGDGPLPVRETDVGLTLPEVMRVATKLLALKDAGAPIVNSRRYFRYFAEGRNGYRCHRPKLLLFVDGRGDVEHCLDLSRPLGNIRRQSLRAILDGPRFRPFVREAEGCSSCNSPTMVDLSHLWEDPTLLFAPDGIALCPTDAA